MKKFSVCDYCGNKGICNVEKNDSMCVTCIAKGESKTISVEPVNVTMDDLKDKLRKVQIQQIKVKDEYLKAEANKVNANDIYNQRAKILKEAYERAMDECKKDYDLNLGKAALLKKELTNITTQILSLQNQLLEKEVEEIVKNPSLVIKKKKENKGPNVRRKHSEDFRNTIVTERDVNNLTFKEISEKYNVPQTTVFGIYGFQKKRNQEKAA